MIDLHRRIGFTRWLQNEHIAFVRLNFWNPDYDRPARIISELSYED